MLEGCGVGMSTRTGAEREVNGTGLSILTVNVDRDQTQPFKPMEARLTTDGIQYGVGLG